VSETITATDEFRRHHGDRYEAPHTSQTVRREYGRIRPWYETMALKGGLRPEQAMAARELDMLWHVVHDATGIVGAYGDQRWNGTPIGQTTAFRLLGPEWKSTCRVKLADAAAGLDDTAWKCLVLCIEHNESAEAVGRRLGYRSKAQEVASRVIRDALHALARQWGYFRAFGDP